VGERGYLGLTARDLDVGFPSETIKEGRVRVLVPKLAAYVKHFSDYAPSKAPVFYNPVMELNRDLSVLALQAYQRTVGRELVVCEPLSSSGIRGVRFAAEVKAVKNVLVNDISARAVKLARHNVELNSLNDRVEVENKDANCLLSCHGAPKKRFDVIDLDPFGSPVPYVDSAIRALRNDGLLAVTATDLAPLCGVHPKACIRKYGGKPLRTEYCHELAIRLLLGCVASSAARHEIGIRVLFSHSTDHYVRAYVQIHYGAKKADESIKNLGYILHCFNCLHRETAKSLTDRKTEKCPECGSTLDYSGPLWLDKILDRQFCSLISSENSRRALRNSVKIARLLELASNEADAPATYYVLDKLSGQMSLPVPSISAMINALLEGGFATVPTHFNSRGLKTEAPALKVQEKLKNLAVTAS
jgi:tRNA (guanine26-N2/guanine27-N2)-dimethyltransferase